MADLSLVIMAAGMGSRYGGLKQLDEFGPQGQTIMDYAINDAIKAGFNHLVFVIRKSFYEDFLEKIGKKYEKMVKLDYAFQELTDVPSGYKVSKDREKPLGTGHAILITQKYINNNFAIINADDYYGKRAFELLVKNIQKGDDYCNIVYPIANTLSNFGGVSRGVCSSKNDILVDIVEVHNIRKEGDKYLSDSTIFIDDETIVSMNCWGFNIDFFSYLKKDFLAFCQSGALNELKSEFLLPEIVDRLVKNNIKKVKLSVCDEKWYGVTYQEDRLYVCQHLAKVK